jgi:threonine dehydrogenase-like Zn-dependent dehydrogenase
MTSSLDPDASRITKGNDMTADLISALVLDAPHSVSTRHFPRPQVSTDDALLRPELVGLCGTDFHTFEGIMPYPFPLLLGHEIVGTIEEAGADFIARHGVRPGDRVSVGATVPCSTCRRCRTGAIRLCESPTPRGYGSWTSSDEPPFLWGGMADLMYLAPNSVLQPLERHVSLESALVGHTIFANGVQWLKFLGGLQEGESVLVQGCGPLGMAAALAAKVCGASQVIVAGLERDRTRLAQVEEFGCRSVRADEGDLVSEVRDITGGELVDVTLNVTGSPASIATSVACTARQGRVLLAGLGGPDATFELPMDVVVRNELVIHGCYGKSHEAHSQVGTWLHENESLRASLATLVSHEVRLDEVPAILAGEHPIAGDESVAKVVIRIGEGGRSMA